MTAQSGVGQQTKDADMPPSPQATFLERANCINCESGRIAVLSRGKYRDQPLLGFINVYSIGNFVYLILLAAVVVLIIQLVTGRRSL